MKTTVPTDAVLTFGNDAGAETFTFSDTTNQFELSDDLQVTGAIHATTNLSASGTLAVDGTVKFNSVTYTFPGADGSSSGKVLATDSAGNLSWTDISVENGSGGIIALSPEYPNAVYFFSGSTYVGQLSASGSVSEGENFYYWETSKSAQQDYWISTRVRVPDNFSSWDPVAPIQFRYQTSSGQTVDTTLKVEMLDTADAIVPLTGGDGLANTSWTTANITGPESTGTYTAGGYITIFVKLAAVKNEWAKAGWLELNWETTTP